MDAVVVAEGEPLQRLGRKIAYRFLQKHQSGVKWCLEGIDGQKTATTQA